MKTHFLKIPILLTCFILLSACGGSNNAKQDNNANTPQNAKQDSTVNTPQNIKQDSTANTPQPPKIRCAP